MRISHHIHFIDRPGECYRQEFVFDPPADLPALIGNQVAIYDTAVRTRPGSRCTMRKVPPIVSPANVLHLAEVVDVGEVVSVELRADGSLADLHMRQEDDLLLLAAPDHLLVWITAGAPGLLVVKARVANDKGRLRHKLAANQGDLPLREYLTAQLRAPTIGLQPATTPHKDVLTHEEAAAYLGMGKSTLYRRVKAGQIRRSQGFKYRRVDLDAWLTKNLKRR